MPSFSGPRLHVTKNDKTFDKHCTCETVRHFPLSLAFHSLRVMTIDQEKGMENYNKRQQLIYDTAKFEYP